MLSHPASNEPARPLPPPPAAADSHALDAQKTARFLEILDGLIATGVEIAEDIRRKKREDLDTAVDASRALDRVARNLRRCMLLSCRLTQARSNPPSSRPSRTRSHAPHPRPSSADRPDAERLDRIGTGTIPEILADLARDLEAAAARYRPTPANPPPRTTPLSPDERRAESRNARPSPRPDPARRTAPDLPLPRNEGRDKGTSPQPGPPHQAALHHPLLREEGRAQDIPRGTPPGIASSQPGTSPPRKSPPRQSRGSLYAGTSHSTALYTVKLPLK